MPPAIKPDAPLEGPESSCKPPIRLLFIEDSENDVLLILHHFRNAGYAPVFHRVASAAEMRKALSSDELRATWTGLGTETPNLYGDNFGKFVSAEIKRWAEVVKTSGAKLD